VIVIGSKPGEGRRAGTIGALLLAVYDERDQLTFAGHVGTGFTDVALRNLQNQLADLERSTPPVPDVPREYARHVRWVEPVLLGEVAFRNWTPDNRLRHPSWRGLRTDRSPSAARRAPAPIPPAPPGEVEGALQAPDGRWRVEIVRRGRDQFFRLIHGDNVIDGLDVESVEQMLAEAGIDMADLGGCRRVAACRSRLNPATFRHRSGSRHGLATLEPDNYPRYEGTDGGYMPTRLRRRMVIAGSIVILLAAVLLSPLFLAAAVRYFSLDWVELGNAGQSYGFIATLVSALALIGVTVSISAQVRQNRTTQRQAFRTLHAELLKIAASEPDVYMPCYGAQSPDEVRTIKQHLFCAFRTQYQAFGFESGEYSELMVREEFAPEIYGNRAALEWWLCWRHLWYDERISAAKTRFVQIIDEEVSRHSASSSVEQDVLAADPGRPPEQHLSREASETDGA
jgi:hypothetical protein